MGKLLPIAAITVLALGGAGAWWFARDKGEEQPAFPAPAGPVMDFTAICARQPDAATSASEMAALGWVPLPDEAYPALGRAMQFALIAGWSATEPGFDGPAEVANADTLAGYVREDYTREDRKDWYQIFTRPEGGFARITRDARVPGLLDCTIWLPETADADAFEGWINLHGVESHSSDWARLSNLAMPGEGAGLVTAGLVRVTDAARGAAVLGTAPETLVRAQSSWRAGVAE